jgi:hypothetical protein
MFKKTLLVSIAMLTQVTALHATELKVNVPIAAHHTSDRHDGGDWNEFFLDDPAFGVSIKNDDDIGFSLNYAHRNSYGSNSSIYATVDYQPTVYEGGFFNVNLGIHGGLATGYKEINNSGVIPFLGASTEIELGNFSVMGVVTPPYKDAPVTLIGMARFKAYEW